MDGFEAYWEKMTAFPNSKSKLREVWMAAAEAEREACAKVYDDLIEECKEAPAIRLMLKINAVNIKARSNAEFTERP